MRPSAMSGAKLSCSAFGSLGAEAPVADQGDAGAGLQAQHPVADLRRSPVRHRTAIAAGTEITQVAVQRIEPVRIAAGSLQFVMHLQRDGIVAAHAGLQPSQPELGADPGIVDHAGGCVGRHRGLSERGRCRTGRRRLVDREEGAGWGRRYEAVLDVQIFRVPGWLCRDINDGRHPEADMVPLATGRRIAAR